MRECPNYGARVTDQDIFCGECGARVPGGPTGPAEVAAAVTGAVPGKVALASRKFPLPFVVIGGVAVLVVLIACGVSAFILVNRSRSTSEPVFLGASSTPPATRPQRVSAPIGDPVFEDTFADNAGEWSVWEDEHGTKSVEDGVYYIAVSDTEWASWGTADRTFDDFVVQVEAWAADRPDDNTRVWLPTSRVRTLVVFLKPAMWHEIDGEALQTALTTLEQVLPQPASVQIETQTVIVIDFEVWKEKMRVYQKEVQDARDA